jgi:CDP-diacylglycerol--serine O-phosphatidyltransferase
MPIPAGAGVIAAVVHFFSGQPFSEWWMGALWIAMLVLVAFLMVSTWRFYSTKGLNLKSRHPFQLLILICGIGALVWFFSHYVLFILAIAYMSSGIFTRFSYSLRRRSQAKPTYKELPDTR